jgi:hypothetical protein
MWSLVVAVGVSGGVSGCGDSGNNGNVAGRGGNGAGNGGNGGGAGGGGEQSGCSDCGPFGDVLDAFCGVIDRCPGAVYPIAYRSRGECVAIMAWATTCRLQDDEVNDVHHYTLTRTIPAVTPAAAGACAAWLKQASCEAVARLNEHEQSSGGSAAPDAGAGASPCLGVLQVPEDGDDDDDQPGVTPPLGAGERCRNGDQASCRAGLYCASPVFNEATSSETCATCTVLPGLGQPCGQGYFCAAGLFCKAGAAGDPQSRSCQEPQADGSACAGDGECRSGFCRRPSAAAGVCDPGGAPGAACTVARDCRLSLMCNPDKRCEPPRAHGAPCTADDQCAARRCDTASQLCGLPDGVACRLASECRGGYCNDTTRLCATRKPAGQACTSPGECLSGDCRNRLCFDRCGSDRPCPAGQVCDFGTQQCRALGADGAGCQDDEQCTSGWCNSADRCATKPGLGDACTRPADCYPLGYCNGGRCTKRIAPGGACQAPDACQEPFLCRNGRCEIINLACAPARAGAMCAYLRICEDAAYCDVIDGFTCKPRKAAGETCALPGDCKPELTCQSDLTTGNRRCAARQGAGAACQADDCAAGLHCIGERNARTCMPGPAGQPCGSERPCPAGYHCDDSGSDNVCRPPLAAGQRCITGRLPCAAGLYCDPSAGCIAKKGAGEACSSTAPCVESLRCTGVPTTCQPRSTLGGPCESSSSLGQDSGCEAGLFCEYDQTLKMAICQAPRPLGAICSGDTRCASGACGTAGRCITMNVCKAPAP